MARKTQRPSAQLDQPAPSPSDAYRSKWAWDDVAWGTHCVDCYPGSCMYHVYLKDGKVAFEEVAGSNPPKVPAGEELLDTLKAAGRSKWYNQCMNS